MAEYLGEKVVKIKKSKFKNYKKSDWAMYFVESYGQIDGSHHKQWVLDQVAQILNGTEIILSKAKWDNGEVNWRVNLGKPSKKYKKWRKEMLGDFIDNEYEYSYDKGIAP